MPRGAFAFANAQSFTARLVVLNCVCIVFCVCILNVYDMCFVRACALFFLMLLVAVSVCLCSYILCSPYALFW